MRPKFSLIILTCLFIFSCKETPMSPKIPASPQEIWCTLNFKINLTNFLRLDDSWGGGPQNHGEISIYIHSANVINEYLYPLPAFGESWEKEWRIDGFKTGAGYSFKCMTGEANRNLTRPSGWALERGGNFSFLYIGRSLK